MATRRGYEMVKRVMDVTVATVALLLLSPLLVAVAVAVRTTMGAPVLFRQQRLGLRGRPFTILKFRTLSELRDTSGELLADEFRMTNLGRFLRRASLDELPELVNVLRGEMSLVGPRPLLLEYLPLYSAEQARRHEVQPGITGWTQVNGRNALTWDAKFRLDVWYVDHRSWRLDVRILFRTVGNVLRGTGIAHPGAATMANFTGNADEERAS